jgi:hypothetical protein
LNLRFNFCNTNPKNQSTTTTNVVVSSVRSDRPHPHATTRITPHQRRPTCWACVRAHHGVIFNLPTALNRDHSPSKVVDNSLHCVDVTLRARDAASSRSQQSNPSTRHLSTRLVSRFRCISERVIARTYSSHSSARRSVRRNGWFRRLSSALLVFQLCSASGSRAGCRSRLRLRMGT